MTKNITTTGAPYALGLGKGKGLLACASLAEASRVYRGLCEQRMSTTGKGATGMPEGLVYDASGTTPTLVARVSWNGKLWALKPWEPGDEPLFSPAPTTVEGSAR